VDRVTRPVGARWIAGSDNRVEFQPGKPCATPFLEICADFRKARRPIPSSAVSGTEQAGEDCHHLYAHGMPDLKLTSRTMFFLRLATDPSSGSPRNSAD